MSTAGQEGKLIVIEGSDGSGKTTQTRMLLDELAKRGIPTLHLKFPQYETFYGAFIKRYLVGEFGDVNAASPYFTALPFMLDISSTRLRIRDMIERGGYVVSDRYVSSNTAHHGAKLTDPLKREEFEVWLEKLSEQLQIVPPDKVVYLHMPYMKAIELSSKRNAPGTKDIHEDDMSYRQEVERVYRALSERDGWTVIEGLDGEGALRAPDEIHRQIVESVLGGV